jgi:hypothetical protein
MTAIQLMNTKPAPKKQQNRRASGTLNKLQDALGLSKKRVSVLLKAGMPSDPQAALAWRSEKENGDTVVALRKERIALVRQQERRARLEADVAEGRLVSRDHVHAETTHDALAVRGSLIALENDLPGKLLGLRTHGEIRRVLHTELRKILNKLAEGEYYRAEGVLEIVRQYHPGYVPTSAAERPDPK